MTIDDGRAGAPTVADYYGGGRDLGAAVRAALRAAGHDVGRIAWDVLAPMDQLHTGGRDATAALARRAALGPGDRVLDVGGGGGGPARMLAATRGCHVTVLDLTPAYAHVGALLTARTGLADRVSFETGDATALPYLPGAFDVVWTQHSTMNVADRPRLYAEVRRVLRPGGRYAMHEVVAGDGSPLHFPVPWAPGPALSVLLSADATRAAVADAGFAPVTWEDVTAESLAWARERVAAGGAARAAGRAPPALGPGVLLGDGLAPAFGNLVRNLEEGRAAVIAAVFARGAGP